MALYNQRTWTWIQKCATICVAQWLKNCHLERNTHTHTSTQWIDEFPQPPPARLIAEEERKKELQISIYFLWFGCCYLLHHRMPLSHQTFQIGLNRWLNGNIKWNKKHTNTQNQTIDTLAENMQLNRENSYFRLMCCTFIIIIIILDSPIEKHLVFIFDAKHIWYVWHLDERKGSEREGKQKNPNHTLYIHDDCMYTIKCIHFHHTLSLWKSF